MNTRHKILQLNRNNSHNNQYLDEKKILINKSIRRRIEEGKINQHNNNNNNNYKTLLLLLLSLLMFLLSFWQAIGFNSSNQEGGIQVDQPSVINIDNTRPQNWPSPEWARNSNRVNR